MHPDTARIRQGRTDAERQGHHGLHRVHLATGELRNAVHVLTILAHLGVQHAPGGHVAPEALRHVILEVLPVVVEEPFAGVGGPSGRRRRRHRMHRVPTIERARGPLEPRHTPSRSG